MPVMLHSVVRPNRGYTQTPQRLYAFTWQQRTQSYCKPTNSDRSMWWHIPHPFAPRKRRYRRGGRFKWYWSVHRAADVTRTQMYSTSTDQHDRGIPSESTLTCTQRTLLKRDANRRLIGQLVVVDVKQCRGAWKIFTYIDVRTIRWRNIYYTSTCLYNGTCICITRK